MILGNVTLFHKTLCTFIGGTRLSCETANFTGNEKSFGLYGAEVPMDLTAAIPNGYVPGYSWVPPMRDGGMSSYTLATSAIDPLATMAAGRNLDATAALILSVFASQLDQVVPLQGSSAMLITGSGSLAAAVAMDASGTLVITLVSAQLGGIFDVTANGAMTLSPAVIMTALGNIEASAGGPTPLSPEGLTEQLLDNTDIETGYSMREALRLILSSVAGKLSGAGTATITIRSVNDTKDRIIATVDANGNRQSLVYDVEG